MDKPFVVYEVPANPDIAVDQLTSVITSRKLVQYLVVNHRRDMTDNGVVDPPWAYTVIFGNPGAGAKFMATSPRVVSDLPVRIGIHGDAHRSVLVYHRMEHLLGLHDERLLVAGKAVDQLVEDLCQTVGGQVLEDELQ